MTLDSILAALGLSPERAGELAVVVPALIALAILVSYVVSVRRSSRQRSRTSLAKGIVAGAGRRHGGLSQEELIARLRPETQEQGGAKRLVQGVAEALLKLVNFDKAKTQENLVRSGQRDPKALSRYIIQRGMGMLVGPLLLWFLLPPLGLTGLLQVAGSLVGVLAGGIVVDVKLDKAVAARRAKIHTELPVLLDLLTIYLEAGSAFDVALMRSSSALRISFPVAAAEILHLRRELEMSIDRERTLREFARRLDNQTAKTFVAIVIQSERRGNAIAPALRRLARDARKEVMAEVEKKAQKIPTVMQLPMFVFILPSIFASVLGPVIVQVVTQFAR